MTLALEQKSALTALEAPGKQELKSEFIELRAKGWSYIRIANKLKVSKSTLSNWRGELENEIASLKAMELEALYEKYYLTKEGRLKLLGETLKAIQKELSLRKLKDISTDKLVELQLKIYEVLKEEYTEARPLSSWEIEALK